MKKLKSYIIRKIVTLVTLNFDSIIYFRSKKRMAIIRSIPNVYIHETSGMQLYSDFDVKKIVKEIRFDSNVNFLKFCNVLVGEEGSLKIEKNVFFNNYCAINCFGTIEIGENSIFGEGVKMYDHNHAFAFTDRAELKVEREKFTVGFIKVGKNCWIGSNVTILKNVEIGDNVIIGANCLIHKSVPSNSIVKANTAYIIENINP